MIPYWREEPISRAHDRDSFTCGDPALDEYLKRHARQNHERAVSKTFVAVASDGRTLLGFYSLSPVSLSYADAPDVVRRGQARYDVAGFRLGRLAVAVSMQGHGLGGQLLLAAGRRCLRVAQEVGGVMLLIDAKTQRAAAWYESFGAVRLDDRPLSLVLPLATVAQALVDAGKT
jgi:GNAT superfamily N-acetyltransferase